MSSSYSRESRSYYSRSSSYENKRSHSSSYRRRPLSSLLIERDLSPTPLDFDDAFLVDLRSRRFLDDFDRRLRFRFDDFDDDFFGKRSVTFHQRNIPVNCQRTTNSSTITRTIPVQYENNRQNSFTNQSFRRNENRISPNDWPVQQEPPTRKRTSMTIFLRQPHIQYSDASDHQRTMSSGNYSTTYRSN